MLAISVVFFLGASEVSSAVATPIESSSTAELSLHVGGGYSGEPVALVRPRLRYARPRFSVSVGAPLVFGEQGARREGPEAWAAWLEELDLDLDGWALRVAPLVDYGDGMSVDRLTSRLGPVELRNALRMAWRNERFRVALFSDGLLDPRVVGASFESRPLRGRSTRLSVRAEGALDPRAPSRLGPTPVAAADLRAQLDQRVVPGLAFSLQTSAGSLFREEPAAFGWGSSLAVRLGPADRQVRLEGGARWAGRGYVASYFDRLYSVEREAFRGVPKADVEQTAGWIGRGSLSTRWDALLVEVGFERGALPGGARVDASVTLEDDEWRLRALGARRVIERFEDAWALDESSLLTLDFSHRVWRSLFVFAAASHRSVGSETIQEGFAGVGFGQAVR